MSIATGRELGPAEKVSHEDDLELEALARAARLLGLWAAGLMELEPPHQDSYAEAVIRYDHSHTGDEAILRKIAQDLAGAGLKVSEDQVRGKRDEFLAISRGQVQAQG